ncbi:protein draper [Caerostris darwini]|uniref:Protein draper n=1 Tax=Caerostris darwini TaxID=1538125 RepID=A0AAV4VGQ7_9ARAC|nr:protein draper [Caerostris darwini]
MAVLSAKHGNKTENSDDHICSRLRRYTEPKVIIQNETYLEPYTAWCVNIPPTCTYYRIATRVINNTIEIPKFRTIYECCEGYEKREEKCSAVCEIECVHGKCVKPNTCVCEDGWQGFNCSSECEDGWYGEDCKMYCTCQHGATCDKRNGSCHCAPGFAGKFCESACPYQSEGKNCENECKCKNGGECNLTNGTCDCRPGYIGKQCEKQCQEGSYGKDCKGLCACNDLSTVFCSHTDGKCMCVPGWEGDSCFKKCGLNTWGLHCDNKCECPHNAVCDHITGECSCRPGWHGSKCEEKCSVGYFGNDCKMRCPDCMFLPGTCHHVSGWCSCPAGARGSNCDLECPENTYGENCENECICVNNSTCDSVTGNCTCAQGWIGQDCSMPCPKGFYGLNCSFACNCTENYACDAVDGTCACDDEFLDVLCINDFNQSTEFNSNVNGSPPLSDSMTFIIAACVFLGLFLLIFFAVYVTKKMKRSSLSLRKEETSTTNVVQECGSPSISSYRFMNPNYDSTEAMETINMDSIDMPSVMNNLSDMNDETFEFGGEEFGIPDCEKASSLMKSNIEVLSDKETSRKNTKCEAVSATEFSSTSTAVVHVEPEDRSLEDNSIYAEVEYGS